MRRGLFIAWLGTNILAALALTAGSCNPRPVVTPPFDVAAAEQTCGEVWQAELKRPIEPGGLASCVSNLRSGWTRDQVVNAVRTSPEYVRLHTSPPIVPLATIKPAGRIFTADGKPWRWKGVSAFGLLDRFAKGQDISDFLTAYQGFNVLRVWPYVPKADWGASAWDVPPTETIKAFLTFVRQRGWYVELTLLTDDDPARIAWAKSLIVALTDTPGLFLEIGNEPLTHKSIDVAALEPVAKASGLLWTNGVYEDAAQMRGSYGVAHTARDSQWPRRAHDLLDFYNGGGPNLPSDPKHHFPIVADEPAKLQDVHPAQAADWRAYFAACALMGAGATFHSQTGKFGKAPTAAEAALAKEAVAGLDAFPADAPLRGYGRPVENSLRTYTAGNQYMVRIRPTGPPPAGWTCDKEGITCTR